MMTRDLNIKRSYARTIVIVIGVVIAIIMTVGSTVFTAENDPTAEPREKQHVPSFNKTGSSNATPDFNSGTRLLHIFTRNLPYLNHK